ncbi:MAG: hypothetical protein HY869_10445 [Chloroflexi bacterium]|nr:hypothetical protein [Chloroflexota bacterium]
MKNKLRLLAAVLILAVSLTLLVWGFWPTRRETLVTPIQPSNLTLPTPSSFFPDPGTDLWSLA